MAVEDFEWDGELELAPGAAPRKKREGRGSWLARVRASVWLQPAARLLGGSLLLGVLAGIGVVATTYAKPGVELPQSSRELVAALGTTWLKPTPQEPPSHTPPPGSSDSPRAPAPQQRAAAPAAPLLPSASADAPPAPASGVTSDGKIILNVASAEELTRLPGVGMKRAQAIVELRTRLKRFRRLTDLLRVKGIGPRGLRRMLPMLVLDAP